LKEKYYNGKAKLRAVQESEKKDENKEEEDEEDVDDDDELWDFVRESLDRLKSNQYTKSLSLLFSNYHENAHE